MKVILWLLCMNGVQDVPTSLYKVKKLQSLIGDACKVEVQCFAGQLGHTYYMVRAHSLMGYILVKECQHLYLFSVFSLLITAIQTPAKPLTATLKPGKNLSSTHGEIEQMGNIFHQCHSGSTAMTHLATTQKSGMSTTVFLCFQQAFLWSTHTLKPTYNFFALQTLHPLWKCWMG